MVVLCVYGNNIMFLKIRFKYGSVTCYLMHGAKDKSGHINDMTNIKLFWKPAKVMKLQLLYINLIFDQVKFR